MLKLKMKSNFASRQNTVNVCGVGLKNGFLKDADITASSTYSQGFLPRYGRLDRIGMSGAVGGWLQTSSGYYLAANKQNIITYESKFLKYLMILFQLFSMEK